MSVIERGTWPGAGPLEGPRRPTKPRIEAEMRLPTVWWVRLPDNSIKGYHWVHAPSWSEALLKALQWWDYGPCVCEMHRGGL